MTEINWEHVIKAEETKEKYYGRRRQVIYVAGPYSKGDQCLNTRTAIEAGEFVISRGAIPIVPHLCHFWHTIFPHPYNYWTEYDIGLLNVCDGLLRIEGDSAGTVQECFHATRRGIPIFYYSELLKVAGFYFLSVEDKPR